MPKTVLVEFGLTVSSLLNMISFLAMWGHQHSQLRDMWSRDLLWQSHLLVGVSSERGRSASVPLSYRILARQVCHRMGWLELKNHIEYERMGPARVESPYFTLFHFKVLNLSIQLPQNNFLEEDGRRKRLIYSSRLSLDKCFMSLVE